MAICHILFLGPSPSVMNDEVQTPLVAPRTVAQAELRSCTMNLVGRMIALKLETMENILINKRKSPELGAYNIFNDAFDQLISNEFHLFHVWLHRTVTDAVGATSYPNAQLVREVVERHLETPALARYTKVQAHNKEKMHERESRIPVILRKREDEIRDRNDRYSGLDISESSERVRRTEDITSLLLRGSQAQLDHDQFVRRKWSQIRSELRYLRTIRAPQSLGEPIPNPQQISLEWLDVGEMSDEQIFELGKLSIMNQTMSSTAANSNRGTSRMNSPGPEAENKGAILSFAAKFRAAAALAALPVFPRRQGSKSIASKWSEAQLVGTDVTASDDSGQVCWITVCFLCFRQLYLVLHCACAFCSRW